MGNVVSMAADVFALAMIGSCAVGALCGHMATLFTAAIKRKFIKIVTGRLGSSWEDIAAVLAASWLIRMQKDKRLANIDAQPTDRVVAS